MYIDFILNIKVTITAIYSNTSILEIILDYSCYTLDVLTTYTSDVLTTYTPDALGAQRSDGLME